MRSRSWPVLLVLLVGSAPGCQPNKAATEVPASATATVFSLRKIDCPDCSEKVLEALRPREGFYGGSFDMVAAELRVNHDPALLPVEDILEAIRAKGYEGIVGPGQGAYLPQLEFDSSLDVQTLADQGQAVTLEDHLVAGKITVFDFYADWCEPCREIDAHMATVLPKGDVALRKLNVVDWDSELAAEHLRGVSSLPYVVIYGPQGKRLARISGLHLDQIDAAIAKGRR